MKKVSLMFVLLLSFLTISTLKAEAANVTFTHVVIESNTSLYEVEMQNYNEMIAEGVTFNANKFKFVVLSDGSMFSMQKYGEALSEVDNIPNALGLLIKIFTPDTASTVAGEINLSGNIVAKNPSNDTEFKVLNIF